MPVGLTINAVELATNGVYTDSSFVVLASSTGASFVTEGGSLRVYSVASGGGGGGSLSDGDYGDVVVGGSGTTMVVDSDAVTNAKLANMAALSVKGNPTGSSANPQDIVIGLNESLVNTGGSIVSQKIDPRLNASYTSVSLTDGVTINWNLQQGFLASVVLGGNRTMAAPTNLTAGMAMILVVVQDATGGRTLSWNSAYKFPGGSAPSLTATANAVDVFYMSSYDGTNIIVSYVSDVR